MVATIGQTLAEDDSVQSASMASRRGPSLFVLVEGDRPLALSSRHSLDGISSVHLGRGSKRTAERPAHARSGDLIVRVPDARMSSSHAVLARVRERWFVEDSGSRNGSRVNGTPVQQHKLEDGDLIELGRTVFLFRSDEDQSGALDVDTLDFTADEPLTLNSELARAWAELRTIAPSREIAILIEGESGTGKEVLARQIARWSGVRGDFVGVNCGALPTNLVESELFGSVKGAFSGADGHRSGLIRSADRGCLFLDEIGDLPLASQASLLRVLQEHEVTPVGATRPHPVQLRVVSATHRDLDKAVQLERFRHDLFARIAGFRTRLPALRDRKEDLGILIGRLLPKIASDPRSITFAPDAIRELFTYDWPLNVRELSNALGTAALLSRGEPIQREHLTDAVRSTVLTETAMLTDEQRQHRIGLVELLHKHNGNVSAVARDVGKARTQVQRWMKRYDLKLEDFR
jgi:transcriptional regulator with PAS, ATPase and Fis domain